MTLLKPRGIRKVFAPGRAFGSSAGFTLLEMLVSVTVLALMLALFAQITAMTANTTMLAQRQIDVSMQARNAFDKLSGQLNSLMNAPGVFLSVSKNTGNDEMIFITNSRPSTSLSNSNVVTNAVNTPRCAITGYKVALDPTTTGTGASVMLNCGTHYVAYSSGTYQHVSTPYTAGFGIDLVKQLTSPPDFDYQPLAPNIFRFEVCFLLNTGDTVATPPQDTSSYTPVPVQAGGPYYAALSKQANPGGSYVKAVIVGLAGFSNDVRKIAGDMTSVVNAFPDPAEGQTPLQSWPASTVTSNLQNKPRPVLNSYRVYQRYFYVN